VISASARGRAAGRSCHCAQQAAAAAPRTAAKIPSRTAKTTKLFKSPPGFPNGIAVVPEGLWVAQQKESGAAAVNYHLPEPKDLA